jgi:uncharacterized protein with WD repeat
MKRTGLVWLVCALSLAALGAQQKYALVMGNGAYTGIARLNNPVNDANDMKAALQGLGFTVDAIVNGSRVQMEEGIGRFKNRLAGSKESYGFLFYAGHGIQSGGINYLIPVDADIRSEAYLPERSVSVQAMLAEINEAGNALNIVVLDACRDNPFSWSRGGSRGLQVVTSQPADSIIVYATSAGSTAADGTGRNGLFTGQLLKNLKTPGLEVNEVFRLTGGEVARLSEGRQRPAVYNQFYGTAYLGPRPPAQSAPVAAAPAPAARPAPAPAASPAPPAAAPQTARPGELLRTLGHSDWVWSVAYSPDGRRIVSASYDTTVKIWDAESGQLTRTLAGHSAGVSSVVYSPNGRRIASASWDKTVKIWDAESGRLIHTLSGHNNTVRSVAYSPDGRRIVSASEDKTVKVWDAESGGLIRTLPGHSGFFVMVLSAAYSPDGRRIVSASTDKTMKIWDAETGQLIRTLSGHKKTVSSGAYSPDGRRIVSASEDNTVKIWDAESGREIRTLSGHNGKVTSAAYSPDGRRIVSASVDETVEIWDAESGQLIRILSGHNGAVISATYSPNGRRIVSASEDKTVKIWDAGD